MASVKYGSIVTDIKGKVGGHIFKGSNAGPVLQTKEQAVASSAKLTKADAGRVINTLPLTAFIAGQWRQLTDAQRASWVSGAVNFPAFNKFGVSYTSSGFQCFMTLNFQYYQLNGSILGECPVPLTVPALSDFGISWTPSTTIDLTFSTSIDADVKSRVEASQPLGAGRNPKSSNYKVIAEYDSSATSPTNMYSKYIALYGAVPANAFIWFKITNISKISGQKGVPVTIVMTT